VRIACVGGGPAGLYVSVLMKLRDPGHDVCVYERNPADTAPGWGVTFSEDLLRELHRGDPESASQIREAVICWREQVLEIRGARDVLHGGEVYNISRARLLEILATRARDLGVRIEHGKEVGAPADLADADLIVAADGINSRMRQAENFNTTETVGRNKHIWLGSDKLFTEFGYLFAPSDQGWLWAYAYAINDKHSTFIVECTPETWAGLGFGEMRADEALPVLERIFAGYLDGHRLIGTLGDGGPARWASFRTISSEHWHSGKVVLAGDSARTANFTIGMGTTLAIGDAIALAESLDASDDMDAALARYGKRRQAEIGRILAEARYSERWFENIERYVDLKPHQMGELLWARRSPAMASLPPRIGYALHRAKGRLTSLGELRARPRPAEPVQKAG
jgi:2-polyprenyl-6-methoxyphenol hydroxylase-like FAD-dependent oxidoreductase